MQEHALWNKIQSTNSSGNSTQFEQICSTNSDLIEANFNNWKKVPENLRNNESAMSAYVNTLIAIANYFNAALKKPSLLNSLRGTKENPFEKFDNMLSAVDLLISEEKFDEAIDNVFSILEGVTDLQGNGRHRMSALCFGRLGDIYYQIEDLENSIIYNNYALGSCFEYGDVVGIFNYLENLYFIYNEAKSYIKAEEWATAAYNFALENGFKSKILTWLVRIAQLQMETDKYSLAKETLLKLTVSINDVEKEDYSSLSVLLNNCAEHFRLNNKFDDAKPLYQNAISIRRQAGDNDRVLGQFLHNLAYLYVQVGQLDLAFPLMEESFTIFKEQLPANDPLIAQSLNNMAVYYHKKGDAEKARSFYQDSINRKKESPDKAQKDFSVSFSNIADLELTSGRDFAAKAYLEQIEHDDLDVSKTIGRLYSQAIVYSRLGNYDEAESIIYKVENLMRSENRPLEEFVRIQVELAGIKSGQGKYTEAEAILIDTIKHFRQSGNWLPEDLPSALNNLGLLYFELHEYENAEKLLSEALSIRSRTITEDHPSYLSTLNNLALVYHHRKELEKAQDIYEKVLDGRKRVLYRNHPDVAQSMYNLGMLLLETGDHAQALAILEEQFQMEDEILQEVFSVSSEEERLAYATKLRVNLDTFLLMMMNYLADNAKAIGLAFDLVLRRKAIVIETLRQDRWRIYDQQMDESNTLQHKLNELRKHISRAILDGPENTDYIAHQRLIQEMQVERSRIEAELARQLGRSDVEVLLEKADRYSIGAALDPESVLIEIVKWDLGTSSSHRNNNKRISAYSAFLLRDGEPDQIQLYHFGLAETSENLLGLDPAVESFREAITYPAKNPDAFFNSTSSVNQGKALGVALRKVLIDRLQPDFGDCKRVFIAPDGILNSLPFEALPLDNTGYVSDNFVISYLSSGRELIRNRERVEGQESSVPIVVANPAYDLPSSSVTPDNLQPSALNFSQLKDTEDEGMWISDEIEATLYIGAQALESVIKNCQSPRILHLATHGFFLPKGKTLRNMTHNKSELSFHNPMLQCGLALAGANNWLKGKTLPSAAEDGLLTAEDVCSMNLFGTELVVLSACESGLGDYRSGEGVFGLRRAFEIAGTHSLVMSLWKVPSEPTQILMKEFYRQLLSGKSRVDAIRIAKAILRRRYPEVFYWGGFVLSGRSTPIY